MLPTNKSTFNNIFNSTLAWIALRQVLTNKGQNLSFMTYISILGVAVGVCVLVVVLSVMGGFARDLRTKMFQGLPHVEILAIDESLGFSLDDYPLENFKKIFAPTVDVEPFTQADLVIQHDRGISSITLFGLNPKTGGRIWNFKDSMIEGRLEDLNLTMNGTPSIILGAAMATQLNLIAGDQVTLLRPQAELSGAMAGEMVSMKFRVAGFFSTELPNIDHKYGVVSLENGRLFMEDYDISLSEKHFVTGVALTVKDAHTLENPSWIKFNEPNLKYKTWIDDNKSLLFALKLEKFTMSAILLLIVVVAAFSISGTLMMTVYHKRRRVAILRAMGMKHSDVMKLFFYHGWFVGTLGVALGLFSGIFICAILKYSEMIQIPQFIFYQSKLPVEFLPLEYACIALAGWILTLLAALYPAYVASTQNPSMGLRYT